MTRILVTSASYLLTDHLLSSEGVFCYQLFRELGAFGYQFDAISAKIEIKRPLKNLTPHKAGTFRLEPTSDPVRKYITHIEFIFRSFARSMRILRGKSIDIIHHMLPAVYNQTFSLLAILKRTGGRPFIMGPLSAHIHPRPLDERILQPITSKLHKKTIEECTKIITITNQVKKIYSQIVSEDKIHVIPFGVDTEAFKPNKTVFGRKHQYEILFVGSLYRLKGCEHLIKAMKYITQKRGDVILRIVGVGRDMPNLMEICNTLKIRDFVFFEGFMPYNEMPRYYDRCDIFCLPTLGEPFGKSIIEAMACGKPVIASNIGGPAEIIEDGKTGLLVPPAQPKILAEKILTLLEDEQALKRMGENARRTALEKYSIKRIAEEYHKLYKSLI
ncbi:MAG: glycosyltransferase [Candidatus Bathyarchaeia archaeon]